MRDENVSLCRQATNHYHILDGLSLDSGWTEVDYWSGVSYVIGQDVETRDCPISINFTESSLMMDILKNLVAYKILSHKYELQPITGLIKTKGIKPAYFDAKLD